MQKLLLLVLIAFFGIAFIACHDGLKSLHGGSNNTNGNNNSSTSSNQSSQSSLPPGQVRVTKQEFGDTWPLTVDEGVLACKGSKGIGAVLFIANGKTYALNGIARGEKIYQEIDALQAKDPKIPGVKKSVSPLIDRGLKLCQ